MNINKEYEVKIIGNELSDYLDKFRLSENNKPSLEEILKRTEFRKGDYFKFKQNNFLNIGYIIDINKEDHIIYVNNKLALFSVSIGYSNRFQKISKKEFYQSINLDKLKLNEQNINEIINNYKDNLHYNFYSDITYFN
jgi:hypothetical protein